MLNNQNVFKSEVWSSGEYTKTVLVIAETLEEAELKIFEEFEDEDIDLQLEDEDWYSHIIL